MQSSLLLHMYYTIYPSNQRIALFLGVSRKLLLGKVVMSQGRILGP